MSAANFEHGTPVPCTPDGVVHPHVDRCYEAGVEEGRRQAWEFLRAQARAHRGEPGDDIRRGALNQAADRIRDHREVGRP